MKLTYSLILAATSCGMAYGATATAFTTPVGYVTINVPANSDTTIAPPLEQPPLYAAASTSITGNDVGAAGLTAGAFVSPECYLQVTSGTLIGQRFPITANTTTTITVQVPVTVPVSTLQSLGFASTNTFKVIPYWTLSTLFPAGAGVGLTSDPQDPSSFVMASSTAPGYNKPYKLYVYCDGTLAAADPAWPAGWYDNDDIWSGPIANNVRIDFARMYAIRTIKVAAQTMVVKGQVPDLAPVIQVAVNSGVNDNYLAAPYPVDVSLQDSGLQSMIQAVDNPGAPLEIIYLWDEAQILRGKPASKGYVYVTGNSPDWSAGWYDQDDIWSGAVDATKVIVLKTGHGLMIRKAPYTPAGSVNWTPQLPYTISH